MNKLVATKEDWEIGKWLSAALDDVKVCEEMKSDIDNWMNSKDWSEFEKSINQLNIKWEKINPERNENG